MTILTDTITFTLADFNSLSTFAKNAATGYIGDYPAYFSALVNRELGVAKNHAKTMTAADPVLNSIISGLAAADAPTLLAAAPLLSQLNTLLNPITP